jgi:hypothetical protein
LNISFSGVKPPDFDVPVIELETPEGARFDLYNECSLIAVVFEKSQLAFDFLTLSGQRVRVLFREVRSLRVEQPRDWVSDEWDQIEHLLIRRQGPWPQVLFKAGGLSYEFDAAELALVPD